MSNFATRWIARHIYSSLIKTDLKTAKAQGINNPEALARYIYKQHNKVYAKYSITFEEVYKVVEDTQKQKKSSLAKLALMKGKKSIQQAIKDKRLVFLGCDSIEYIDSNNEKFSYTFAEMAHRCIDNIGHRQNLFTYFGITDLDFQEILEDEYRKQK